MGVSREEGDTPMNDAPTLDSIEGRLSRALRQFVALRGIGTDININTLGGTPPPKPQASVVYQRR